MIKLYISVGAIKVFFTFNLIAKLSYSKTIKLACNVHVLYTYRHWQSVFRKPLLLMRGKTDAEQLYF